MYDKTYFTSAVEKTLQDLGVSLPSPGTNLWRLTDRTKISEGSSVCTGITEYTQSSKLYAAGCRAYGWEEGLRNMFGRSRPMYANKATKEGYGVWCPCNSVLRFRDNSIRKCPIQNYVGDDKIVDLVFGAQRRKLGQDDAEDTRVTFLKLWDEFYMFYGVIERVFIKQFEHYDGKDTLMIRVYEKISDAYPFSPGEVTL